MKPLAISDTTFEHEVMQSDRLTIVDFWAEWCGPCRMIAPVLEDLAQQHAKDVKVTKLNVDENSETAMTYGIRSIPTLLFFREGKLVDKIIGVAPKNELEGRINRLLEVTAA